MLRPEDNNPRTFTWVHPLRTHDREHVATCKRMIRRCMFPSCFGNGIFNLLLGIWICVIGMVCIAYEMEAGQTGVANWPLLAASAVVGLVLAYLYGSYMQRRFVFPRGGCAPLSNERPKAYTWLVPLAICVGLAAWSYITDSNLKAQIVLGTVFAVLEIACYAKSNDAAMLLAALIVMVLPTMLTVIGFAQVSSFYLTIMWGLPNIGIVLVLIGMWKVQTNVVFARKAKDSDQLRKWAASDDPKVRFGAASNLCFCANAELIEDLAALCADPDETVAYAAQVALGNAWGIKPRELDMPTTAVILPGADPEQARAFSEAYSSTRSAYLEGWLAFARQIEGELRRMGEGGGKGCDALFELAGGKTTLHWQARIVAIEMLGSLRTERAYSALATLLKHRNKRVASAAMRGFFGAGAEAILHLEGLFASRRSWLRRRAITAARYTMDYLRQFDPGAAEVAAALLAEDLDGLFAYDDTPTFAASIALLPADGPGDVEALKEYCRNDRALICAEALCALTRNDPQSAEEWVRCAMSDPRAAVRYAAVLCLVPLRLGDNLDNYAKMTSDRCQRVAALAAEQLEKWQALMRPQRQALF